MREELVTFQVAKLAKEKGFDIPVRYGVFGKKMKLTENHGWEKYKKLELRNWNTSKSNSYSVPTQSLLQRWLRETHDILIYVDPKSHHIFQYHIITSDNEIIGSERLNDWEQVFELGLQEALKLIKL